MLILKFSHNLKMQTLNGKLKNYFLTINFPFQQN